jgi:hypothetical protein
MATAAELVVRVSGDVKNFDEALKRIQAQTENLNDRLAQVGKVAAVAFAALTAQIYFSAKAYAESEKASNRLNLAMQNAGVFSTKLAKAYKDQAAELQKLTGVDDDVIVTGQAVLQTFVGQKEVSKDLTTAMLDLSAAKEIDLATSAELIGKGIQGQTMALKKLGVEIADNLDKQQRTAAIIKEITRLYGGFAAANNQGLGGINRLKAAFGDLNEAIGQKFSSGLSTAIAMLTRLVEAAGANDNLVSLAAALISGGSALAAMITTVTTVGQAITATSAIATAFGFTLTTALGPIALLAGGAIALAAGLGYVATSSSRARDQQYELNHALKDGEASIAGIQAQMRLNPSDESFLKPALADAQNRLAIIKAQIEELRKPKADERMDAPEKHKETEEERQDRIKLAQFRINNAQMLAEAQGASAEMLALKRHEGELLMQLETTKNAALREALIGNLNDNMTKQSQQQALDEIAFQNQFENQATLYNNLLANNETYQAMSVEQQRAFLIQNEAELKGELMTLQQAKESALKDELKQDAQHQNQRLKDQAKFGKAYAQINAIMHSEIYTGSKQAFGELAQLTSSSNSTLKGIGKVAAVANIIIKTAESAMNIYAGFSTIPIIGPALGIAGAAAAVAFGGEQVKKVTSAASGGVISGRGGPTADLIPAMLSNGEFVTPARSYDEVVNAVAAQRAQAALAGSASGGGQVHAVIEIRPAPGFGDFVEATLIERESLGTSLLGA